MNRPSKYRIPGDKTFACPRSQKKKTHVTRPSGGGGVGAGDETGESLGLGDAGSCKLTTLLIFKHSERRVLCRGVTKSELL